MQILINAADPQSRHLDHEMVTSEVNAALERFADQITRVEVHVKDVNGPKSGEDKQCTIEARLAGLQPMVATAAGADVASAVSGAAGKLQRLIESDLGRRGRR